MEGRLFYAICNEHRVSRFTFHVFILLLFAPLALAAQTLTFTDVTAEAGIGFKHTSGRSGEFYFVEQLGSGAAFFDYDNDGDLDIYFVDGADLPGFQSKKPPTNHLYQNNGDGTFTDVTDFAGVGDKSYGIGCCVGDYDNDGHLDLYVTNFGKNRFYRNNGDGTFTDVADRTNVGDVRWGASCAFADYDNDGHLDLYVTNYVQYQLDQNKTCQNKGSAHVLQTAGVRRRGGYPLSKQEAMAHIRKLPKQRVFTSRGAEGLESSGATMTAMATLTSMWRTIRMRTTFSTIIAMGHSLTWLFLRALH